MYKRANNVLGTLKYDIAGGAAALVIAPLATGQFALPPAPSDGAATFGQPFVLIALADRLDPSQAKYELILCSVRAAELAGAYTFTVAAGGRGWEGTAAQAWTAGAYAFQVITDNMLQDDLRGAIIRAQMLLVHKRDAVMTWDGANFLFDTFTLHGAGRGKHWASDGIFTISMPANGTVVVGFGGAANTNVAAGAVPIAANTALYYEPNISAAGGMVAGNLRLVATGADYAVPEHWILLAVRSEPVAGDAILRVANGATLHPWRVIGAGGQPAFGGTWVNSTGISTRFRKDESGVVYIDGNVKSGVSGTTVFTLPAGYRPGQALALVAIDAGGLNTVAITTAGALSVTGGTVLGTSLWLPPFLAAA